jgi:uncharacterized protein YkwD
VLRKFPVLAVVIAVAACAPAPKKPVEPTPAPAPKTKPDAPAPAPGTRPSAPASVKISGIEQKIVAATNGFRKENRLSPLKPDVRLIVIAQQHARNMARQDRFGDTDKNGHVLDGNGLEHRIQVGGYTFGRVAENVGYQLNKRDPAASMMEGWKTSPGHRRNLLLSDVTEIGVGAAQGKSGRWYFVQVFGRPADPPRVIKS